MRIIDLNEGQLKQLYCAAMGWHTQINGKDGITEFDEFYDKITCEWNDDRWTIRGAHVQIEITEDLFFRCGMIYNHSGIGGTAFNLKAVCECLLLFDILP